jgi:peptide/nickel transport system ATP-binding protein
MADATSAGPVIEARGLTKRFVTSLDLAGRVAARLGGGGRDEIVHAVDSVDLTIQRGEVVGLVGESGCGKSTLGRMIAGILPPTSGQLHFKGQDRATLSGSDAKAARLAVQMIFQDPSSSLNPRRRVEDSVGEAPLVHGLVTRARALAVKPEFLVCDEAIAALDVSIQAQVINLFMDLRRDFDLTYLFISHDLGVVQHIADRIVIMYLGRIVEAGPVEALCANPNHPYAQALLNEVPRVGRIKRQFKPVVGEIPSPLNPPPGCHFHPRCPVALAKCREVAPPLVEIAPGRLLACHLNSQT